MPVAGAELLFHRPGGLLLPRPASRSQRIEGNKVSAEFATPDDLPAGSGEPALGGRFK